MESKSPYFQQHIKWGHCSEQSWGEPFLSSALLWYCVKHKTGQRRYRVTEEWIWGGLPPPPPGYRKLETRTRASSALVEEEG